MKSIFPFILLGLLCSCSSKGPQSQKDPQIHEWRGEMKLVSYDEGTIEEVGSFKITRGNKEHFSHPVIRQGVLYVRHGDVLMAFDIS